MQRHKEQSHNNITVHMTPIEQTATNQTTIPPSTNKTNHDNNTKHINIKTTSKEMTGKFTQFGAKLQCRVDMLSTSKRRDIGVVMMRS